MAGPLEWLDGATESVVKIDPDFVQGSSRALCVKRNVAYIVAAVILRGSKDDAEVLMIQEVKGDWYLPAGRMEPGETVEDGMKREVKEEAGIDCQSLGLICVDAVRPAWYCFTYLAKHTGGDLKTQADNESLQASWFRTDMTGQLSSLGDRTLRSHHVISLIRIGMEVQFGGDGAPESIHCARMIERPIIGLLARFVLICENQILLRRDHFPIAEYSLGHHLGAVIIVFLQAVVTSSFAIRGMNVISLEARPVPKYEHDGSCLTILIDLANPTVSKKAAGDGYQWTQITQQLADAVALWRKNHAALQL